MNALRTDDLDTSKASNNDRVNEIHSRSTIIDAEAIALILPTVHLPPPAFNGKSYLDRAIEAGVTAINTSMGVGGLTSGVDNLRALLHSMYGYLAYFELHPDKLVHVEAASDILRAKKERKLGVIFGIQGLAGKLDGDLTLVRILHKIGLRIVQLTNNDRNSIGGGALDSNDSGLSLFGKACVRELNRVGIVVDVAHAGEKTGLHTFDISDKPCIISHANVRALTDHPRNVTDVMLKALAKNGGVIGITALAQFNQRQPGQIPTVENLVDHIAYVANLVGVDHVGIGTDLCDAESEIRHEDFKRYYPEMQGDFHFGNTFTKGFERVDDFPNLTATLVGKGFSDEDVSKILGGNLLRVFKACWAERA